MARQRDEKKKEIIIKTATELFARKGFHATSIQDIVAESGLSVGTIYLYFANKEEIFDALLDGGIEILRIELFQDIDIEMSNQEKALRFTENIMQLIKNHNKIVTVIFNELSFQNKLQNFYQRMAGIIAERFHQGDAESIYGMLKLNHREFFVFVTIVATGIANAIRISLASGELMDYRDVKKVLNEIILKSLVDRIEINQ